MKRIEFLRTALLGAIAIAAIPSTVFAEAEIPKLRQVKYLKVTKNLLEDKEEFNKALKEVCKGKEIAKMDIGWMNDDFVKDLYTVVVTFK